MKKLFLIIAIAVLLVGIVVTSFGCATEPATTAAKPFATQEYVTQQITAVNSAIAKKADQTVVDGLSKDITDLEKDVADINTSTDSYSKSQVDAKFNNLIANLSADQIAELKNKLDISSSSGSSGSGDYDNDQFVDHDDDLDLYLTDVNPASIPVWIGKSGDMRFDFTVENNDDSSHEFTVEISFYPDEDVTLSKGDTEFDIRSDTSMTIRNTPIIAAPPGTLIERGDTLSIYCENGWVNKNNTQDFTVLLAFDADKAVEWDYDIDIRQTD